VCELEPAKKQRQTSGRNPPRKSPGPDPDIVEKLTAAGLNADAVAQIVNVNKNTLPAQHALALANGRAALKKRKAEERASALTPEELHVCNSILLAFDSGKWIAPDGRCLLWRGTDGDFARSPADAFRAWQASGRAFICAGLNSNFSCQQLQRFAALKAEAEKLRA